MSHSEAGKISAGKSKVTSNFKKKKRIEEYNQKPKECNNCYSKLDYDNRHKKFCSQACAAIFNNKKRIHSIETKIKMSINTKKKINEGKFFMPVIKTGKDNPSYKHGKYQIKIDTQCEFCSNIIEGKTIRKFCSDDCLKRSRALQLSENLKKYGKMTKTETIQLPFNGSLMIDSNLERRICIMFDENKIFIKRPKITIPYFDENNTIRYFVPDFLLSKNGKEILLEIKDEKLKLNSYVKYISQKKKAMKEYCMKNNLKYFWLTAKNESKALDIFNLLVK